MPKLASSPRQATELPGVQTAYLAVPIWGAAHQPPMTLKRDAPPPKQTRQLPVVLTRDKQKTDKGDGPALTPARRLPRRALASCGKNSRSITAEASVNAPTGRVDSKDYHSCEG